MPDGRPDSRGNLQVDTQQVQWNHQLEGEHEADVYDEKDMGSPTYKSLGLDRFGLDAANSPKAALGASATFGRSFSRNERPNTAECARPATAAPQAPVKPHVTPENPIFGAETRAALVVTASLRDPADRMARDLALNSLQRLATGAQNKMDLWGDEGNSRQVLLDAASMEEPEDNEGRCCALGCLWNIAGDAVLRSQIWADEHARSVVLKAVTSEKLEVKELGLGILWGLSPNANAAPMWQDVTTRKAVVAAATSPARETRKGRAYAMAILQNLAEETANRESMWGDYTVRDALKASANLTFPDDKDLRGRALGALMNISVNQNCKQAMWGDAEGIRAAILEAASLEPQMDDKSRGCALAAVWCMAIEPKNRVAMLADPKVRSALTQAASPDTQGDLRSRERALGTLQYLSTANENKELMWEDEGMRAAIGQALLSSPSDGKAQIYGLGALWNLSSSLKNQEKIWKDDVCRKAVVSIGLLDASAGPDAAPLRERASAILWNLSNASGNKVPMWKDAQGARTMLLKIVSSTLAAGEEGKQPRQYALGALRNMADESRNKLSMWNDVNTRRLLIHAARSPDAVSARRAFKAICALVHEQGNRNPMWNDDGRNAAALAAGAMASLTQVMSGAAGTATGAAMSTLGGGTQAPPAGGARALIVSFAKAAWSTETNDTHTSALIALQAMSVEAPNKEGMWNDTGVREALAASAGLQQPEAAKARLCAISTIKNLTTELAVMEGIWGQESVRAALREAAQPGDSSDQAARARSAALGALRNLASNVNNKEPMWNDTAVQAAIVGAAAVRDENASSDAREARMHAIAALRSFASISPEKTDPLWGSHDAAKDAIKHAAQLQTSDKSDVKARGYAVAALRHVPT